MPLRDPVAVFNPATSEEANLVRNLLVDADVEAFVTEEISEVFGSDAAGSNPQVWVERANVEQAQGILEEYERQWRKNRAEQQAAAGPPVEAVCEECGQRSAFPGAQKGSVQNCPHCHAFMDVGEPEDDGEWADGADEESEQG
jgi:hypothetical protein